MRRKFKVLAVLVLLMSVQLSAQKTLVKAYKALSVYNYFEARNLFKAELKKGKITFYADTTAKAKQVKNPQNYASAAFGLGIIYLKTDNPFSNTDTAYLYARLADSLFTLATPAQKAKLKEKNLAPDSLALDSLFYKVYTRGYNEAKQWNTIPVYQGYINRFPLSPYVAQVSLLIEDIDWEATQKENSYKAYLGFATEYPSSKHNTVARNKYELRLFQTITAPTTVEAFRLFVDTYPDSPYRKNAEDSVYLKSTATGKVTDFTTFIRQNPANRNIDMAWEKLYNLYNADGGEATLRKFKEEYPDYPGADRLGRDLQLAEMFLMPFIQDGKYGYIDTTGKIIIAPQFDYAEFFSDGLALVEVGGKTGYINKSGKFAVSADFVEGTNFDGNYAIAKKGDKFGVIGRVGNVILPFDYDDISSVSEPMATTTTPVQIAVVTKGDKQGYVDLSGARKYPVDFEEAGDFYENIAVVKRDGKYGYMNAEGEIIIAPTYDWADNFNKYGTARVKKDGLLGLIYRSGQVFAPCKYTTFKEFEFGAALVTIDGKYGFVNTQGVEFITAKYPFATSFALNKSLNDTLAKVEVKGKRSYIHLDDKQVFLFRFEDLTPYAEGMLGAKQKDKWGFIDKNSKMLIPFKFEMVGSFKNGMALAGLKGKIGLINKAGKWVIEPSYDEIFDSYVENGYVVSIGDKYGLIDRIGAELLPLLYDEPSKIIGDVYQLTKGDKTAYYNFVQRRFVWKQEGF